MVHSVVFIKSHHPTKCTKKKKKIFWAQATTTKLFTSPVSSPIPGSFQLMPFLAAPETVVRVMMKTYGAYLPQHGVFGIGAFFRLKPSMILKIVPSLAKNNLLQISSKSRKKKGWIKEIRLWEPTSFGIWLIQDPPYYSSLPTEKQRGWWYYYLQSLSIARSIARPRALNDNLKETVGADPDKSNHS